MTHADAMLIVDAIERASWVIFFGLVVCGILS